MKKLVSAWILVLVMALVSVLGLAEMPAEDQAGNPIQPPELAESIASLAPSITQVLVDLGLADRLVAVDTYSQSSIAGLPEGIDAFDMMTPDMERLIALSPDLVLVSDMSLVEGSDPFEALEAVGVCVAHIPSSSSIEGIMEDTLFIGQIVGEAEAAQGFTDALQAKIDTYRVETDEPVRVYFEIGPAPVLYSFGSGTFLNEMIEIIGGVNIFADQDSWISPSEEAVIAAAPEVIYTNVDWMDNAAEEIMARSGWDAIPAVAEGRVYLIDGNASSQPNHHIIQALEEMAEALKK